MRDNDEIRAKVWKVWELGKTDLQYRLMLEELREKEKEYGKVLGIMSIIMPICTLKYFLD